MNEDLVAMLERERLSGMPRWQVRPGMLTPLQQRERAEAIAEIADADAHLSNPHILTAVQRRRKEAALRIVRESA